MKDNINSFLNLAKEKFLSKEYDKAIGYLEKIILIEKNNLPALVFMGDILVHKKLYLNAIKIHQKNMLTKSILLMKNLTIIIVI